MRQDAVLSGARWMLRAVLIVNWAFAAVFAVGLALTVPFDGAIAARLAAKYGAAVDATRVVMAIRVMFAIGLAAVAVAWVICTRLLAMIATVAAGDPFVAANGTRLTSIACALVWWQVIDLAYGALTMWLSRLHVEHAAWTPSFAGWIVVMMVFVLARVFAVGAAMRDELEATV